ncbi:MAG TPA: GAF domain-containing protein [Burkholderiales bacterium]|nr:GAF domain-containing protein [Burkholderiales bacterium]
MPIRFNAYPPDRPAVVRILDENKPYRIGRAAECELRIDHPSVSRFHAELSDTTGADAEWRLHDTGSKNGLRVNGHATLSMNFSTSGWFAVGDVYCWLEFIDAGAATNFRAQTQRRREGSREMSMRISSHLDIGELISQTLDVVIELSGLERGFVLFAPASEPLRVRANRGLAPSDLAKASFSGSAAAVDQALNKHEAVVCCDTNDSPWLGLRPSVRLGGIRAVLCVPLQIAEGGRGAIYVDSRKPGPPVTELDLELIESVAQHASAAIAAGLLHGQVRDLLQSAADLDEVAPRWDELHPL